jgi:signal peptidase I
MVVLGLAVAVGLGGVALAVWLRYVAVTVRGSSMAPTLSDGDLVLVRRAALAAVRRGDVVVVASPHGGEPPGRRPPLMRERHWIVKRATALPGEPIPGADSGDRVPPGSLYLLGDNPAASCDSRGFGCVAADRVLGIMVRPLGRAGTGPAHSGAAGSSLVSKQERQIVQYDD